MRTRSKLALVAVLFSAAALHAQMSLSTAVDLALRNDPKVKVAQAEVARAKAALSQTRDVFIPAVSTSGGVGDSTGVPLGLPVIFNITAQSLAFNFSQPDIIRAAHSGLDAAQQSLLQTQNDVAEDAASTYVSLDNARQRRAVLQDALAAATRLSTIVQERFDAGAEPHIEVSKSLRTQAQFKLQVLALDDEIEELSEHLSHMTGIARTAFVTQPDSIPPVELPAVDLAVAPTPPGILAAQMNAQAKAYQAHGDSRYKFRPQMAFNAEFSRISTALNDYASYYPGFNETSNVGRNHSNNSFGVGVEITMPLLDYLHAAKARESRAEAERARWQAETQRLQFLEGRSKLARSLAELTAQTAVMRYDRDIAKDELEAIRLQLQPDAGAASGPQMSPKDEQNATLQERQRTLDLLTNQLKLDQTTLQLMEQSGTFSTWLHHAVTSKP